MNDQRERIGPQAPCCMQTEGATQQGREEHEVGGHGMDGMDGWMVILDLPD